MNFIMLLKLYKRVKGQHISQPQEAYMSSFHSSRKEMIYSEVKIYQRGDQKIIEQPKFRTITVSVNENFNQELERSWIGLTENTEWTDMLQE